ncbi:phosphonate ABC transporter ATP-binding protein [uncultured Cycloclasticus sp.]|uniref:phosphonate ABC transporter ATP-binding protein n=1 Tax=uncultured Cycloclasticus sp. TaxID=172194 RepID=UPI00258574DD|nr:phosphonate ABC transporter ATP-binding protein [uncultured Cycloclasticus sp.]
MLTFKSTSVIYGDGTKAVDNIDLTINKGEFCVLLGPSGAGKSTLMGLLNGLVTPTSGQIALDGVVMNKKTKRQIQQKISMIHQQLHLVPRLKVLHNVLMGKLFAVPTLLSLLKVFKKDDQQRACMLLQEVDLEEKHLYRRASNLSGGQQQRVAIARAFMSEPQVVLADEPVASLDPMVSRQVLTSLKAASRNHNATVLCSLHQVEYALEFADRIIAMKKGQVVFSGRPDELDEQSLKDIYGDEYARDAMPLKKTSVCSGEGELNNLAIA